MSSLHMPHPSGRDDLFIVRTLDGSDTLYSREANSTYHSIKGAVSESRHVFIQNGLAQLSDKSSIRILEFGFGSGLNAFLAMIFSKKHQKEVFYSGIESQPVDLLTVSQLNYPEYLLASAEKPLFLKMHIENFSEGGFHFRKYRDSKDLPRTKKFDIIFFDAFSPEIQPEYWSQEVFSSLFARLDNGGVLVTYCAKGEVRRRMTNAEFIVERLPGAPGKRHMLRGIKRSPLS